MDSGRFFCTSDFIGDAFCVVDILSTILRNDSHQKNELEPTNSFLADEFHGPEDLDVFLFGSENWELPVR